jgi:hypothetical protein
MDAAPASRRSVELSAIRRGRSRGLTSDHRGTRRAVMIEFYTTMRVTGRRPGIRCNEGWFRVVGSGLESLIFVRPKTANGR